MPWRRRLLQPLGMASRGRRGWIAARGLRVRKLPAPEAYALLERGESSLLITEFVDDAESARQLLHRWGQLGIEPRGEFLKKLGRLIAQLHERGAYQHDLRLANVLVRDADAGQPEFVFVDLEGFRFRRRLRGHDLHGDFQFYKRLRLCRPGGSCSF